MKLLNCLATFILFVCDSAMAQKGTPIDAHATAETKALYKNLHKLAKKISLNCFICNTYPHLYNCASRTWLLFWHFTCYYYI
jgi:hypothetical protein